MALTPIKRLMPQETKIIPNVLQLPPDEAFPLNSDWRRFPNWTQRAYYNVRKSQSGLRLGVATPCRAGDPPGDKMSEPAARIALVVPRSMGTSTSALDAGINRGHNSPHTKYLDSFQVSQLATMVLQLPKSEFEI